METVSYDEACELAVKKWHDTNGAVNVEWYACHFPFPKRNLFVKIWVNNMGLARGMDSSEHKQEATL